MGACYHIFREVNDNMAMCNLLPSIKFRLRVAPQKTFFRLFFRSFARRENFSSARNFFFRRENFRPRENLGKKNLSRRDRFRPKIVEIGAILAIFEPFENWKFTCHFWANSADLPRIYSNLIMIRTNPGTIA